MEHYHCVKCYIPNTGRVRDVDTLEFFPKQFPFPAVTTEDYLKQAVADILSLLKNQSSALPSLEYDAATENVLVQIATLLGRVATPPPEIPTIRQPDAPPLADSAPAAPPTVPANMMYHRRSAVKTRVRQLSVRRSNLGVDSMYRYISRYFRSLQ
jgi:hypothetical protein